MQIHNDDVVLRCFYHLYQLWFIRWFLTFVAMCILVYVVAFICSHVDYCNAVLDGAATSIVHLLVCTATGILRLLDCAATCIVRHLQMVLHAAVALITGARCIENISHTDSIQLHPRNMSSLFHGRLYSSSHCYVHIMLHYAAHRVLIVMPTQTKKIVPQNFRFSGPDTWESLPCNLRNLDISRHEFVHDLKIWLFHCAYLWDVPVRVDHLICIDKSCVT